MMFTYFQVNAFSTSPQGGNPAGVCPLERPVETSQMQEVATLLNHSQTAFYLARKEKNEFDLRWFSPLVEVSICVHATFATAFHLFSEGLISKKETIIFHTKAGLLTASYLNNNFIQLKLPALGLSKVESYPELEQIMGVKAQEIYQHGLKFCLVLGSREALKMAQPDLKALIALGVRAVSLTAPSDSSQYDFCSRYFAPIVGINEDPVCGSSHCFLSPLWANKLDKKILKAHQDSKRGGELELEVTAKEVLIRGQGVKVLTGQIN